MTPPAIPSIIKWSTACFISLIGILTATAASQNPNKIQKEKHSSSVPEPTQRFELKDDSQIKLEGPARFIEIAGIKGLNVTSIKTKAEIQTDILNRDKGTLSVWMSSLEDLGATHTVGALEGGLKYPILGNKWPTRMVNDENFSLCYQSDLFPPINCRFVSGDYWKKMDFGVQPSVYQESLDLKKGQWYHLVITWDKKAETLKLYINGQFAGCNSQAKGFVDLGNTFFVGNPMLVVSHLEFYDEVLNKEQSAVLYRALRPNGNDAADQMVKAMCTVQEMPPSTMIRDQNWTKVYDCPFTQPSDLEKWTFQTGDEFRDQFILKTSKEGLYWQTPSVVAKESRAYLWSPVNIEGDQWVEFDFQLVSPKGLALVMINASGMQGEDYINDHPLSPSGSMREMLQDYRSYAWEYVRRVAATRTDVECPCMYKNPWGKTLYYGLTPRLEQKRWHKLDLIRIDTRIVGLIDNKVVFDVLDNPYDNNGPSFRGGRVILREMYNTTIKYRNFRIFKKD